MPTMNMKKEYRAELRELTKSLKAITRSRLASHRARDRAVARLKRQIEVEHRAFSKVARACDRQAGRLLKRQRILAGRLAS